MGYLSHDGLELTDIWTSAGRIVLSHPLCQHSLVLFCVESESGYQPSIDGWAKADGRSLGGGIRVLGRYQRPIEELQCSFLVSCQQLQLFDWLKRLQDDSDSPLTCQDWIQEVSQPPGAPPPNWLTTPVTNDIGISTGYQAFPAWVDTDRGYKTPATGSLWWMLQFQVLREV